MDRTSDALAYGFTIFEKKWSVFFLIPLFASAPFRPFPPVTPAAANIDDGGTTSDIITKTPRPSG
tara:strand:+ start:1215 stop:1409 length:195 start_codon:yes stop_codon:yes gene_type:complete